MTKKDRIAISITITTFFFVGMNDQNALLPFGFIVVIYWAYRFIKNDISFMQRSPKTKNDKDIGTIDSKADALLKWNDLLAKGVITQEEYDKAKRDLLG